MMGRRARPASTRAHAQRRRAATIQRLAPHGSRGMRCARRGRWRSARGVMRSARAQRCRSSRGSVRSVRRRGIVVVARRSSRAWGGSVRGAPLHATARNRRRENIRCGDDGEGHYTRAGVPGTAHGGTQRDRRTKKAASQNGGHTERRLRLSPTARPLPLPRPYCCVHARPTPPCAAQQQAQARTAHSASAQGAATTGCARGHTRFPPAGAAGAGATAEGCTPRRPPRRRTPRAPRPRRSRARPPRRVRTARARARRGPQGARRTARRAGGCARSSSAASSTPSG